MLVVELIGKTMPQIDIYLKKQARSLISDQQRHISLSGVFQTIIYHDQKSRLLRNINIGLSDLKNKDLGHSIQFKFRYAVDNFSL